MIYKIQPMSNVVIQFKDVSKRYAQQTVLSGVTLDVQEGETLGLVGVNGAGKTTMFKCLLDFTRVDDGSIEIYALPSTSNKSRSHLAYLPEKFIAPYYLTGKEYLLRGIKENHSSSFSRLSYLYEKGNSVRKDSVKAKELTCQSFMFGGNSLLGGASR